MRHFRTIASLPYHCVTSVSLRHSVVVRVFSFLIKVLMTSYILNVNNCVYRVWSQREQGLLLENSKKIGPKENTQLKMSRTSIWIWRSGDYVDRKSENERKRERERASVRHPAHVRRGRICPSIWAVSLPPSTIPSSSSHNFTVDIWIAHMCTACCGLHSLRRSQLSRTLPCNV
jgi:hypothetical protein